MLDYRAHKLHWLISLSFRLINRIMLFALIFVGVAIAELTSYSIPIKIVIAYVSVEAIGIVVYLIVTRGLASLLNRFFFVDVVPAHGDTAEEARAIALMGRTYEINKNAFKASTTTPAASQCSPRSGAS
jgi:hypothetical protein